MACFHILENRCGLHGPPYMKKLRLAPSEETPKNIFNENRILPHCLAVAIVSAHKRRQVVPLPASHHSPPPPLPVTTRLPSRCYYFGTGNAICGAIMCWPTYTSSLCTRLTPLVQAVGPLIQLIVYMYTVVLGWKNPIDLRIQSIRYREGLCYLGMDKNKLNSHLPRRLIFSLAAAKKKKRSLLYLQ